MESMWHPKNGKISKLVKLLLSTFVEFSIVTWHSTIRFAIGKVLPCNKKVMSLTPDRDNILKTWVHVVLNLMKCILQLIGLNKLKGQYAYLHTSTFSSQHFFFLRVQLYIVCMYIVFFLFQIWIQNAWLRTKN